MQLITFYPGPAKVYPQVAQYMQDAYESGVLSINHRSQEFMEICRKVIDLTKFKLNIPADYTLMFVSSATESWEIISQSLAATLNCVHLYSDAFGRKWYQYDKKLNPDTTFEYPFSLQDKPEPDYVSFLNPDMFCFTQNETANGTQVRMETIRTFRQAYPDALIAVDVTSSLAGIELDFRLADVWFASVQKCLGLPAGLGVFICSPRAIERSISKEGHVRYNSLSFIYENIEKYQTPYTPNVLNIYLLMRVMEQINVIQLTAGRLRQQAADWYAFLENFSEYELLINNPEVRSDTVITVKSSEPNIRRIKELARQENIVLGNGYGTWKDTTFRIANFPAIAPDEIALLKDLLSRHLT
jgi:phosphoserine aminotransferase